MGKIPAAAAAALFEEIIGWPYMSPGTNDQRGIDCSGAWVRVYKKYSLSIAHGSNSQFRKHCASVEPLTSATQLAVGMPVFKCRPWKGEDKNHSQYGQQPGNLYHVGCVTSVNPLRIVHATPEVAKVDTSIKGWGYFGRFTQVDYADIGGDMGNPITETAPLTETTVTATPTVKAKPMPGPGQAMVVTNDKRGLNLRELPDRDSTGIKTMPDDTIVTVFRFQTGVDGRPWVYVRWDVAKGLWHEGWCCADFLEFGGED